MFQTEVNHFVQSFASTELTAFMRLVTSFGYGTFFVLFLIFLLLTVDFKKVAFLFLLLSCTTIVTLSLKAYFNMPRPYHVDHTLERLDGRLPDNVAFHLSGRGAASFWAVLPPEVLTVTRQATSINNGFPSGHASIAIVFWGALALLFQKRWLSILSATLMVLIPFSRIYLGVHFLADVIGGIILGAVLLAVFYALVLHPEKRSDYF
jgi:membrane-associated phospholipid phosphatase